MFKKVHNLRRILSEIVLKCENCIVLKCLQEILNECHKWSNKKNITLEQNHLEICKKIIRSINKNNFLLIIS